MFDWNDLKYFLAVADEGSTLKAARTLGANQTTVARRITALEEALDVQLFERRQAGYRLSDKGEELIDQAHAVAAAVKALEDDVSASAREIAGVVRLTTNETYAEIVLPPLLAKLRRQYPGVKVEVEHTHKSRDLAKGEADVALRQTKQPKGDALVARHLFDERWTCFCSKEYADEHGLPRNPRDMKDHAFIGGGGPRVEQVFDAWLAANAPEVEPDMRYDSMTGMVSAARAGLGITFISTMVASHYPELVQIFRPQREGYGIWLVTHDRIRKQPHVRAVMTGLGDLLVADAKKRGVA